MLGAALSPVAAHASYPGQQPGMSCKTWVILSAYGTSEYTDATHRWGDIGVNNRYIRALAPDLQLLFKSKQPRPNTTSTPPL